MGVDLHDGQADEAEVSAFDTVSITPDLGVHRGASVPSSAQVETGQAGAEGRFSSCTRASISTPLAGAVMLSGSPELTGYAEEDPRSRCLVSRDMARIEELARRDGGRKGSCVDRAGAG